MIKEDYRQQEKELFEREEAEYHEKLGRRIGIYYSGAYQE